MPRRKSQGVSLNLDSLLDTLTNVVGFLIILLVLMHLGVKQAVQRIREADASLPMVSQEELQETMERAQRERRSLDQTQSLWQQLEPAAKADAAALATLEKQAAQMKQALAAIPQSAGATEVRTTIDQRERQVLDLEKQIRAAEDELAKLKAMLDDTPRPQVVPAKTVTLPNPRPAPEGAQPFTFLVREGKVYPLDTAHYTTIIHRYMKLMQANWKPGDEVDCDALVTFFEKRNLGDNFYRIRMKPRANNVPLAVLERRPDGGEDAQRLRLAASAFVREVRKAKAKDMWIRFVVFSDSFDAYLAAREVVDQLDLPAGWEVQSATAGEYTFWVSGLKCKGLTPPKPAPPSDKDKPATPPKPPPPKPTDQID